MDSRCSISLVYLQSEPHQGFLGTLQLAIPVKILLGILLGRGRVKGNGNFLHWYNNSQP